MTNLTIGHDLNGNAAAPETAAPNDGNGSSRVAGGPLTADAFGNVTERTVVRVNVGGDRSHDNTGNLMDSVESPSGSRSKAPTLDSTVYIPEARTRTTIRNAIHQGLLRHAPGGGFEPTGQTLTGQPRTAPSATTQQPPQQTQPQQQQPTQLLPQVSEAMAAVQASLPAGLAHSLAHTLATKGVAGLPTDFAAHSTMQREVFLEACQFIADGHTAQLHVDLERQGVDFAAFTDWAQRRAPGELREAQQLHGHSGSVAHYAPLVARYLKGTMPAASALNESGYATRTANDGTLMVEIPGFGWTTAAAAANAGLI